MCARIGGIGGVTLGSPWVVPYPGLKSDNAFRRCPHLLTPTASDLEPENPSPWGPWSHPVALSPLLFYPLPPPSTFFLNTQATSVQKCLPGRPAPHVDLFDESYHPCLITTDSPTSDPKLLKAGTTYHLFRVLSTFSNIFVDCCMLPPKKNKNSGKQERKTWNILELNFHYINWKDPDNAKQLVSSNSFKHDLRE